MTENHTQELLIALTSDIVAAHVNNNSVPVEDVPALIRNVYGALADLHVPSVADRKLEPAVSVRSSVRTDHIVCLGAGKKMKDAQV